MLKEPARISVKTKDGRAFSKERRFPIGSPDEPLTMDQFRGLYNKFSEGILPEREISRAADAILNLEELSDLSELMSILTAKGGI